MDDPLYDLPPVVMRCAPEARVQVNTRHRQFEGCQLMKVLDGMGIPLFAKWQGLFENVLRFSELQTIFYEYN